MDDMKMRVRFLTQGADWRGFIHAIHKRIK